MSDTLNIYNLAKNTGRKRLKDFIEQRKHQRIPSPVIFRTFLHHTMEAVFPMSDEKLGQICCIRGTNLVGQGLLQLGCQGHYQVYTMVLRPADSNRTILQKLAIATILSAMNQLINHKPLSGGVAMTVSTSCLLVPGDILDGWEQRDAHHRAQFDWETP